MDVGLTNKDINFNMLIQGKNDIQKCRNNDDFYKYIASNQCLKTNIIEKNEGFLCSAGRITCTISPYGEVFPCAFFNVSAGSILDSSLEDVWKNSHLFMLLRSLDENNFGRCSNCDNNNHCHVCIANNMNETGIFHMPADTYCDFRRKLTLSLG